MRHTKASRLIVFVTNTTQRPKLKQLHSFFATTKDGSHIAPFKRQHGRWGVCWAAAVETTTRVVTGVLLQSFW